MEAVYVAYPIEVGWFWLANFVARFGPTIGALVVVAISGMVVMYCATSFKDALGTPLLVLFICRSFTGLVLAIFVYMWVLFWAQFRNLVSIFDLILSTVDLNVGRHIDDNPRIMSLMKGTGMIQYLYSYHDYTPHEKEQRHADKHGR